MSDLNGLHERLAHEILVAGRCYGAKRTAKLEADGSWVTHDALWSSHGA